MKHINIRINNENGIPTNYKADAKIIKGLHLTKNLSKIKENCASLNIDIIGPYTRKEFFNKVKFTILGQVCVVTIIELGNKQRQFLILKDLDLNVLKWLSPKKLNGYYHYSIKQAYETMMVLNLNKQLSDEQYDIIEK